MTITIPSSDKYVYYTWPQIDAMSRDLADKIYRYGLSNKTFVAIARGGMVPAAIIANELENKRLLSVLISTRHGNHVTYGIDNLMNNFNSKDLVFIDEIIDSGKTFQMIRTKFPYSHFATLILKNKKYRDRAIFAKDLSDNKKWVKFPWER